MSRYVRDYLPPFFVTGASAIYFAPCTFLSQGFVGFGWEVTRPRGAPARERMPLKGTWLGGGGPATAGVVFGWMIVPAGLKCCGREG